MPLVDAWRLLPIIVVALILVSLCGCEALRDVTSPYKDETLFKRQTEQSFLRE